MEQPKQPDTVHLAALGTEPVHGQTGRGATPPKPELTYAVVIAALDYAANMLRESANTNGYGYYRPANPNDFHPDHESCSAEEIANHKAACEAYDKGARRPSDDTPEQGDGWVRDADGKSVMHILTAPWGIGTYCECDEEMDAHAHVLHRMAESEREAARSALAATDSKGAV